MADMAKDYQIDETETELRLHVPPPNTAWKVAVATIIGTFSILGGGFCFYLWLARSETNVSFLYCIAYNVLWFNCAFTLRVLYMQLAAKQVVFERHVIGIDYRILGIRLQRRWFSAHRVQQWIIEPNRDGYTVLVAICYQDRLIRLVETLDSDIGLSLVARMQRKEFAYV